MGLKIKLTLIYFEQRQCIQVWNMVLLRQTDFRLGWRTCIPLLAMFTVGYVLGSTRVPLKCLQRTYPFLTLHYGSARDSRVIEHNCVLASRSHVQMVVYTSMMELRYCRACSCRRFIPTQCRAPSRHKNLCEKLHFIVKAILRLGAFFYMDSDLIVTRPEFFSALQARANNHDWLAAYGHRARRESPSYRNRFNSGLFFIRKLPDISYSELIPMMYQMDTGNDQSVLSEFVFARYRNWDSLSVRFNCRGILRFNDQVPPEHCLAIHDRSEARKLRDKLNLTLLSVPA